jgi:3-methyl-2-oxobutanoate hydroxymethyltransferase
MNILDFVAKKKSGNKISMVTCYDNWSAKIIAETNIDSILVGDSLAMVVYGHSTTLSATTEMIARHVEAVSKGAPQKLLIADMPFPSFRMGITEAMKSVDSFMKAGAHAVKLEGVEGHEDVIKHIVQSGVPVMGHLGLTPQSIHQFGGFKVQAKSQDAAERLLQDALVLQEAGAFGVVLECVPLTLAKTVSETLSIPTIGIGAGPHVDGQVLVLQDLLGMNKYFKPKFLKTYLSGFENVAEALETFDSEVKSQSFPDESQSYS